MTTVKTARVLIVDDHPFMRRGLAHMIDDLADMEVCAEADGRAAALEMFEQHQPDLTIVDISLGDGSGIELIKEIKLRQHDARILVSSMHEEALFGERAIRAGALGFVNKGEEVETYIKAFRHVLDGRVFLSQKMTDRLLNRIVSNDEDTYQSTVELLSDRELEVFELIGRGFTTKQIAAKLELSRKTIETYREHIKTKLSLQNGTELARQAVQWVLEQG